MPVWLNELVKKAPWQPRSRLQTYTYALVGIVAFCVVGAWFYRWAVNPQEDIGKGWVDLWIQFIAGGWPSDLEKGVETRADLLTRKELSYLISVSFIIQGIVPALGMIVGAAELIELNRKVRNNMRLAGEFLDQQSTIAEDFRKVMIDLLPESQQKDPKRAEEIRMLAQDTAFYTTERWCRQNLPSLIGKDRASEVMKDLMESWTKVREMEAKPL